MVNMSNVQEFYDVLYSKKIRRYPEYDVAAFAASCASPVVTMDLGTGTGRNLLPLLQATVSNGFVIATDLSAEGVGAVQAWADSLGAARVDSENLEPSVQAIAREALPDIKSFVIHRICRHAQTRFLGPVGVFNGTANPVYLATGAADMSEMFVKPGSVDAIVNRGSIFYLARGQIDSCMKSMHSALKPGGLLLLTLKSIEDSRFEEGLPIAGQEYRRIVQDQQVGLEMEFFDEKRVMELIEGFELISLTHLLSDHKSKALRLGDWSVVLKKA